MELLGGRPGTAKAPRLYCFTYPLSMQGRKIAILVYGRADFEDWRAIVDVLGKPMKVIPATLPVLLHLIGS